MWCYITQPNSVVLEVEVDSKAKGQECLDKVCEQLHLIEVDYFGLQYEGEKGEHIWLNMRNGIAHQLAGLPRPYQLQLRVKFFVQPHLILTEEARQLFFLQLKQEIAGNRLIINDLQKTTEAVAYIAQAELGDFRNSPSVISHYATLLPRQYCDCPELLEEVATHHMRLSGLTPESSCYRMLKVMSELDCYGAEYHEVEQVIHHEESSIGHNKYHLAVRPDGLALYQFDGTLVESCLYATIANVTRISRCIHLELVQDDGSHTMLEFKLATNNVAASLYRSITEMHSFYSCDTVRNAVQTQFTRDLKGMVASVFNENTTLGKKYVFDIRRTCREAYDHARRIIYTSGGRDLALTANHSAEFMSDSSDEMEGDEEDVLDTSDCQKCQLKADRYQDMWLCRVCMDSDIETTFQPCGHLVCCESCADRMDKCPLCRADIVKTLHVYPPTAELEAL